MVTSHTTLSSYPTTKQPRTADDDNDKDDNDDDDGNINDGWVWKYQPVRTIKSSKETLSKDSTPVKKRKNLPQLPVVIVTRKINF